MIEVLVLTDFSSGYSRSLLKGIVRYSQQAEGWTFYRMPLYYRMMHGDRGVVEWAKRWKADAIIAQLRDLDINLLRDMNIPIILQNYKDRMPEVCNLTGDYIGTGRLAAEFYINRGFFNFAYYGMTDTIWSRERGVGFRERLAENGFNVYEFLETSGVKDQWTYNWETLGRWLKSLPKPLAIFACDDQFALQISETCNMMQIAVPEEIAILGVDNDELLCNISNPPLSSIVLDVENGGYAAAKVLCQLVNKEIDSPSDITIPALRVESRQSTELYAIRDKYILQTVEYIKQNYSGALNVSELQQKVPLSRRVFEKRFKQNTGVSIYQFIQRHRIDCFANLLMSTDRSIDEIASMCGFDDCKNVARVFSKYKKLSPFQYRKRYRTMMF